jgi:TolB-like protein/Tfp pilus assembly protein PilF
LSLAVFPFRHVGTRTPDEALELGLADTLIAHLSRLPELIVRSLRSAQTCLAAEADPAAAARRLGVDTYLEASLQVRGERLRVNARLVQVENGASLWSESFDERFADVFELQDTLGARIVAQLAPHVVKGALPTHAASARAYRLFLEGRLFAGRHTSADLRTAAERFERALDLAPGYAEAWAALGECHELLATESEQDAAERYASARRAARRALALSPLLPEAECLAARVSWQFDWDWAGAEASFLGALERYPNRGDLHIGYADFLSYTGRHAESIAHARRAVELDPISPWFNTLLAQSLYMSQRFDEALRQAEHAVELAPDFAFARFFNGLTHFFAGQRERGLDQLRAALQSGRRDFLGAVALCAGLAGRADEARAILEELREQLGTPPFALALAHLGAGESTAAAKLFERCLELRDWHVLLLVEDPMFAAFREDEDGARLVERIRPA